MSDFPTRAQKQKFLEQGALAFLGALLFAAISVLLLGVYALAAWVL